MRSEKLSHPWLRNGAFWISLVLLNCLLFAPITFFYLEEINFWPELERSLASVEAMFNSRSNLDMFRFNVELLLLTTIWLLIPAVRRSWVRFIFFALFILQFLYAGLLYVLHCALLPKEPRSRWTQATALGIVLLLGGTTAVFRPQLDLPETAVSSFGVKLWENYGRSQIAYAEASRFFPERIEPSYRFTASTLEEKPDIYMIFIESYGSVLYKRPDFFYEYDNLLTKLYFDLQSDHWHIASNRSLAPTWGGGSWIAYTSAMSGLNLTSHAEYLALFNQYQDVPFPHLVNYLRTQGYKSYRLSAISDELNDIEWQRYKNFYGVDEWLRFSDIEYDGPLYGWGPAPPDQYALHYAHHHMQADTNDPTVFFYITQNSHYPWTPLPTVAADWTTLEAQPAVALPDASQRVPHEELRQQYLDSITYELQMLTNFILTEGDENDVFILVGDHQPARVARYEDGWDTPMHVISKNPAFIQRFHDYGFVPNLTTRNVEPTLHHEGFYPLFMRNLLLEHGAEGQLLPLYSPTGVQLERPVAQLSGE